MAIELDLDPQQPARAARQSGGAIKLSRAERASFLERLALMLEASTPLNSALDTMGRSGGDDGGRLARELGDHIAAGGTLHEALWRHPGLLSDVELMLIAAGERGGFLATVIRKIVDFDTRQARLRSSLISALTYPAVLLCISVLVCVFVLIAVFPQFDDMFTKLGDELPLISRWLFALSQLLAHNRVLTLAATAAVLAVIGHWLNSVPGRSAVRELLQAIPMTRTILDHYAIAQLTRVLGLSLAHGVTVTDALHYLQGTFGDPRLREALADIEHQVNNGMGIAHGFNRSEVFPDLVKQLIDTGEQAGALADVLGKLADHYESDLDRRIAVFGKLAEPLMLVVMGAMVGGLVSALILPIFRLSSSIS